MKTQRTHLIFAFFLILPAVTAHAIETYVPLVAEKSQEGELTLNRFKIPGGMKAQLFAEEPMVANPVTFCFDDQGRIYVAETFRQSKGVEDNRSHMNWLLDDLAARTVADRVTMFKKYLKDEIGQYSIEHDRIRCLVDTDGDGHADQSTVFADGFNAIEDGTGAGLLAFDGGVFYTCIPKLWHLKDTNGDGVAEKRTALYDGFGVRVAFRGHDLHGLVLGPDGRIYFSIGDRGYNVELQDQSRLVQPDQGAVFRCELDGSKLEVFCKGLRNPQELAFDEFGNLFTGDNNSDSGDQARWTYLIEGSDTGWRMYYQYPQDRGPWNREKLWHVPHAGQAAYIVPPIAHFASGPSGLAYYPGTGLDEKYQGHFFLADFRGQAANSGIRTFSLIPKGASFELVNAEEFIWSILATDIDFGPDGSVYVSDWVDGWDGTGKGRIYRFQDEQLGKSALVKEVQSLLKEGFDDRSVEELVKLLAHVDYRIRLRAQLTLTRKNAVKELTEAATDGQYLLARLHGIWGLGQLGRHDAVVLRPLLDLMSDPNQEVRAQIARVCGDADFQDAGPGLAKLVKDQNLRVRSLAAIAVGKLKYRPAFPPLLEALAENADADQTLRHALILGLVGTALPEELIATVRTQNTAIRLGAVVALRRLTHPGVEVFLNDSDPLVVVEAARAIHDVPIPQSFPALAKLIENSGIADPVLRRAINANFRLGAKDNAEAVASFAGNPLGDASLRAEALAELDEWNSPGALDRVTGEYRPLEPRQVDIASLVRPWIESLFASSPTVREAAAKVATNHSISEAEPNLLEILKDVENSPPALRVMALAGLQKLKSPELKNSVEFSLKDSDPTVRSQARRVLVSIDPVRGVKSLSETITGDSISEQQAAVATLAGLKRDDADALLGSWFDQLLKGSLPPALHLDLIDAGTQRGTPKLLEKIKAFNKTRSAKDHLKDYREALFGGNAERGREIFSGRADLSCRRCHKIDKSGGDVGPDLSRIGLDKTREYLLESVIDPNKQIAKGFETVILAMADGKIHAGIVKNDAEEELRLQLPDGRLITVKKSEIDERTVGKSGMPDDLVKKLTKFEIRDLVEFLSTLKSTVDSATHGNK